MSKYYGQYGGAYVPEMLRPALDEIEVAFEKLIHDKSFLKELDFYQKTYVGRATPLTYAKNLSEELGGAKIFLKNEGAALTGAHKINHCIGQILIAKYMGKKKIIAETGAGQHGRATAAVAAKFGMECTVYMGEVDYNRQRPNVMWMEMYGATVIPVKEGDRTLRDAVNAAMKAWLQDLDDSYYLLGSALGPHPYPTMVKYFQSFVGREVQLQLKEFYDIDMPNTLIACVGGGCNSLGLFGPYLENTEVALIGVEAGGKNSEIGNHAARFDGGKVGIVEGYKSYFLQNKEGQVCRTHSISAGLDYAGVGPEHAYLYDTGRVTYTYARDEEVLNAIDILAKKEGVLSALESAHAVSHAIKLAPNQSKDDVIVVNLSGRGDKDLFIIAPHFAGESWKSFLQEQINA